MSEPSNHIRLRHAHSDGKGFSRIKQNDAFEYRDCADHLILDQEIIARINSLRIPPAWNEVWVCQYPNGHIQATGIDAKGRKQYLYHPQWRKNRDKKKFEHMVEFGLCLPKIRDRIEHDLRRHHLSKEKVLATIVYLLEHSMIRVGNDTYAKSNKSFGLTTFRNRHVNIQGQEIIFHFRGKSGVEHDLKLNDARLAKIIRKIKELPGQDLFQYLDEDGKRHPIGSADVNDYLKDISGQDFTAKDFRTWAGTLHTLSSLEPFTSASESKKSLIEAIAKAAKKLGNTPAICKKSYVHPLIIESYLAGKLSGLLMREKDKDSDLINSLEIHLLNFLQTKSIISI